MVYKWCTANVLWCTRTNVVRKRTWKY